jgi:hypothetical protein
MKMVLVIEPICMAISNEADHRIGSAWRDAGDHHAREETMLDGKRDQAGIEMAERHSPLLSHQLKRTLFGFEKPQVVLRLDKKTVFG